MFRHTSGVDMLLSPSSEMLEGLDHNIALLRQSNSRSKEAAPFPMFQLASALVSHTKRAYVDEGLQLMQTLAFRQWSLLQQTQTTHTEQQRHDAVQLLVVYYYYIAIGHIKRDEWSQARSAVERLLALQPDNVQGQALSQHINDHFYRLGMKGVIGTAVAVVGAIALWRFRK